MGAINLERLLFRVCVSAVFMYLRGFPGQERAHSSKATLIPHYADKGSILTTTNGSSRDSNGYLTSHRI